MDRLPPRQARQILAILILMMIVLACVIFLTSQASAAARCNDSPNVCFIKKYWTANDSEALRVAYCESKYDAAAQNGSHRGLFQLSKRYHEGRAAALGYTWEQMRDPGKNTRVALTLYKEKGWQPWTCKP